MKNYIVIRFANKQDGTTYSAMYAYETEDEAWKTFFRTCATAVDSEHLTDAVTLITKEGYQIEYRSFTHEAVTTEESAES